MTKSALESSTDYDSGINPDCRGTAELQLRGDHTLLTEDILGGQRQVRGTAGDYKTCRAPQGSRSRNHHAHNCRSALERGLTGGLQQ